jgi:tetraacyldisaccharide 4'-kinase
MIASNLPDAGVFVGADRLASCRRAAAAGFRVAVLDDGFQHRRLQRDIDIVFAPPVKGEPLRESTASLKRADAVLIERGPGASTEDRRRSGKAGLRVFGFRVMGEGLFAVTDRTPAGGECDTPRRVIAFCGIARPQRFFSLLAASGIHPLGTLVFADHHAYTSRDLSRIRKALAASGAGMAVTTEKDAVRLRDMPELEALPLFYFKLGLQVEPAFSEFVLKILGH